ncbi:MAG TPA: hypothetical protein DDW50_22605 [Firmicutes bacterium]|nr:hypothetical protein [Bacillota bacterium]
MDNQDQNKPQGEISRLLQEKAKQGFEFGKSPQAQEGKDTVHIGRPKSNHTGIDRGRWAD